MKRCPKCSRGLSDYALFCPYDRTALPGPPDPDDDLVNRVIAGKYRVLERLGAGGMGAVYRSEHVMIRRIQALKVMQRAGGVTPEMAPRFIREAQVVSRLDHPNAVKVFDFGEAEDGMLYLAMEFVAGLSLRELVSQKGWLPPPQVVDIIRQACGALQVAHGQGIIHRDLKPENLMLRPGRGGRHWVKVVDFGIAKIVAEEGRAGMETLTQAGMVIGTLEYLSPEYIERGVVDGRSDVYALGVILYELLSGAPPFRADRDLDLLLKHLREPPPPLRRTPQGAAIPADLEAIAMRSLEKKPERRYPDVSALAADLERTGAGQEALEWEAWERSHHQRTTGDRRSA